MIPRISNTYSKSMRLPAASSSRTSPRIGPSWASVLCSGALLIAALACAAPDSPLANDATAYEDLQLPAANGMIEEQQAFLPRGEGRGHWFNFDKRDQPVQGKTTEVKAIELLEGPPFRKTIYADGSYELTWYFATPASKQEGGFRSIQLTWRVSRDGVLSRHKQKGWGLNAAISTVVRRELNPADAERWPGSVVVETMFLDEQGRAIDAQFGSTAHPK